MGRRALPRTDPDLDLSVHLKLPADLPSPFAAAALFGRQAPLEIEVGSGKGLFLASAAAGQPEKDFLGVEIGQKYARFAAARLARRALANARLLHGDALELFRSIPSHTLAAVHVYFPDPWWKARHRKRRVMNAAFAKDIERTLQTGGELHFWTDVEEYFLTTLELLAACTRLVGPLSVPETAAAHDLDYRTHFERRMRLHGMPVYRSAFRREHAPDAAEAETSVADQPAAAQ
jgi:tRNA (guanine-N7-)-methyltransferase